MLDTTEFLLAKNDFHETAKKSFHLIYEDRNFSDVTLACGGDTQMEAHRVILSASSPVFRRMFLANPHQHPLVYLRGLEHRDLRGILEFIYLGQTQVNQPVYNGTLIDALINIMIE